MWTRVRALLWKEILAVYRDPRSRTVLIIPPIMQLLIFTFAATLDVKNIPIGFIDRDQGNRGYELVQRFRGSPVFSKVVQIDAMEEIPTFMDRQEGVMVVSIGPEFSREIALLRSPSIQLIMDGRKSNTAQIIAGYASAIIQQYGDEIAFSRGIVLRRSELFPRNWYNPNLIYHWYNVPNLVGILTMITALLVTSLSVAREREMGTFDQLLVSPISPFEILLGKALPASIIGVAEGSIILVIGTTLLGVPFTGNIFILYLCLIIFVFCAVGVGLFISSLCTTQQQAILGTFVFMSPSVLLAGYATPIENMPVWLQYITYANPLRYILVILRGSFLKAAPFEVILSNVWPLLIIAAATLTAATLLFRSRLE